MKIYVFYHRSDMDGYLSAMIFHRWNKSVEKDESEDANKPLPIATAFSKITDENGVVIPAALHLLKSVKEVIYVPSDYGDNFDSLISGIEKEDVVFFLDFVLFNEKGNQKRKDIVAISEITQAPVVVIDHHSSSLTWLKKNCLQNNIISFGTVDGLGACLQTWKTLHGDETIPPLLVELSAVRDVWAKEHVVNRIYVDEERETSRNYTWDDAVNFSYYWRTMHQVNFRDVTFSDELLNKFFDESTVEKMSEAVMIEEVMDYGEMAQNVIAKRNKAVFDRGFYSSVAIDDKHFKAYIVADYNNNGDLIENGLGGPITNFPVAVDFALIVHFDFRSNLFQGSIMTNPVVCKMPANKIAELLGGGGHAGYAGFTAKSIETDSNVATQTIGGEIISWSRTRIIPLSSEKKREKRVNRQSGVLTKSTIKAY
jgi:hypothetical protein